MQVPFSTHLFVNNRIGGLLEKERRLVKMPRRPGGAANKTSSKLQDYGNSNSNT